jgi:uncharacterized short protein YbdD (DUF466 family)
MANFIPRKKIETPFILILIGDKSKNISKTLSKHTMNSMISMNDYDANMANVKRTPPTPPPQTLQSLEEIEKMVVEEHLGDLDRTLLLLKKGVPVQRDRLAVEYERFQEWCASYVDDPSLPPIEVLICPSNTVYASHLTAFQTEEVLRATFEKYGPIECVFFGLNENASSPNFGKPTRACIKFARDGDSLLARDGERWRRWRLEEEREREALLASSLPQ